MGKRLGRLNGYGGRQTFAQDHCYVTGGDKQFTVIDKFDTIIGDKNNGSVFIGYIV